MFLKEDYTSRSADTEARVGALVASHLDLPGKPLQSKDDIVIKLILAYSVFLLVDLDPNCLHFANKLLFPKEDLDDDGFVRIFESSDKERKIVKNKIHDAKSDKHQKAKTHYQNMEHVWNQLHSSKPAFFGTNRNCLFLVMPLLGEMNLSAAFKKYTTMIDYFSILLAAAIAIRDMHQKNIRHNDLHFDNIRITKLKSPNHFCAEIIDFDEAKIVDAKDHAKEDLETFYFYILRQKIITEQAYPALYQLLIKKDPAAITLLIDQLKLEINKLRVNEELAHAPKIN